MPKLRSCKPLYVHSQHFLNYTFHQACQNTRPGSAYERVIFSARFTLIPEDLLWCLKLYLIRSGSSKGHLTSFLVTVEETSLGASEKGQLWVLKACWSTPFFFFFRKHKKRSLISLPRSARFQDCWRTPSRPGLDLIIFIAHKNFDSHESSRLALILKELVRKLGI